MDFFAGDNIYNRVMTKVFDLCLLSIITTICCIPLFTVGAAFTAMYSVMMKMGNNIEGPIVSSYIKEFKQNIKGSIAGSTVIVIGVLLLCFDLSAWTQNEVYGRSLFYGLTIAVIIMFVAVCDWYLALRARFVEGVLQAFENAFRFAIVFLPITLVCGIYTILSIWVIMKYAFLLLFFPLAGFALVFYPKALLIGGRIDKYIEDKGLAPAYEYEVDEACVDDEDVKNEENTDEQLLSLKDKMSYILYNHTAGIVLGAIVTGLVLALGYHFVFHGQVSEFNLAVVNGYSEEGDIDLTDDLNELFGLDGKKKYAYADTNYQISYEYDNAVVENPVSDTSFFDKFFLNIRTGMIDAAIIPKSFYDYCNFQGDFFYDVEYVLSKTQISQYSDKFIDGNTADGNYNRGIVIDGCGYIDKTGLSFIDANADESYILVFPINGSDKEKCRTFFDNIKLK